MTTLDTDGPIRPLLVYDSAGNLAGTALTNDKGCNKSLENGELWVLDGSTGRLIPLTDHQDSLAHRLNAALEAVGRRGGEHWLQSIEKHPSVAIARLELELGPDPGLGQVSADARQAGKAATAKPIPAGPAPAEAPQTEASRSEPHAADPGFLLELQELIRQRKASLPEGSYTTHLFKAGLGKIRKKTGEEAVELLLAQAPEEIVSESSDLLYHLMVLLVALEIPFERVLAELKRR